MNGFEYHRPRSLAEVWRLRAERPEARYIQGGTDVMVRMRAGTLRPAVLISLRRVEELSGIEIDRGARIGASSTISDILAHRVLGEQYPVLVDATRLFGSMQVRNVASLAGNLCTASPAADTPPALLVLEARVRLAGPEGERELPLEEFFLAPGQTRLRPEEVLTSILLDPPVAGTHSCYRKKGRVHMDMALASVAVLLVMNGNRCTRARVAAGAVAPTPLRLREVERCLEGQTVDAELLAKTRALVGREIAPVSDLRCSDEYRRVLTGALFESAVASALAREPSGERREA